MEESEFFKTNYHSILNACKEEIKTEDEYQQKMSLMDSLFKYQTTTSDAVSIVIELLTDKIYDYEQVNYPIGKIFGDITKLDKKGTETIEELLENPPKETDAMKKLRSKRKEYFPDIQGKEII